MKKLLLIYLLIFYNCNKTSPSPPPIVGFWQFQDKVYHYKDGSKLTQLDLLKKIVYDGSPAIKNYECHRKLILEFKADQIAEISKISRYDFKQFKCENIELKKSLSTDKWRFSYDQVDDDNYTGKVPELLSLIESGSIGQLPDSIKMIDDNTIRFIKYELSPDLYPKDSKGIYYEFQRVGQD